MARSWKAKREIRRNIVGYRGRRADMGAVGVLADVCVRILAVLLAISLPAAAILCTSNLIFRIPDLYNFEIARSGVVKDMGLNLGDADVGTAIAEFMRHKTEELTLNETVQDRTLPVFTFLESARMEQYRKILDRSLIVMGAAIVLTGTLFVTVRIFGRKKYLTDSLIGSGVCFVCFAVLVGTFALSESVRLWVQENILGFSSNYETPDGALRKMFGDTFRLEAAFAVFVSALILLVLFYSLARLLTKEETKMFA